MHHIPDLRKPDKNQAENQNPENIDPIHNKHAGRKPCEFLLDRGREKECKEDPLILLFKTTTTLTYFNVSWMEIHSMS
jgi:hypothetical protein